MDGFVDQHQKALLALTLVVLVVPALLGLFWGLRSSRASWTRARIGSRGTRASPASAG